MGGVIGVFLGIGLAWLAGKAPGVGAFLEGSLEPKIIVQGLVTALAWGWLAASTRPGRRPTCSL